MIKHYVYRKNEQDTVKLDISSLETIPEIWGSRIVENVPTYGGEDGEKGTFEVRYSYPKHSYALQWVNNSAIIQSSLSFCLNSSLCGILIDQIVGYGRRIAEKQEILNPDCKFFENQDLNKNFQNLLQKKIKYSIMIWVMSAKFTVGHLDSKYYLKWTEDLKEVDALYERFKTEYSERLLSDLRKQFSDYIYLLDVSINRYTKFFNFSDYTPESCQEAIQLQTTILTRWAVIMKSKLEEVNERLLQCNPDCKIGVSVQLVTDEKFRKEIHSWENPGEEYIDVLAFSTQKNNLCFGKNPGNTKDVDL